MKLAYIFRLLRPHQWFKNGFIFIPLFFDGQLNNPHLLYECIIAFIAFSLAASSIYCFNDIYDIELDKIHPAKCKRPIASGKITKAEGYTIQLVCLAFSILLVLFFLSNQTKYLILGLILLYYGLNIAYCMVLKQYPIIDVMIIAFGFVLRIFIGGLVVDIQPSEWLVLMTFLLALFLGFAKRRDDVIIFQNTGELLRKNTNRYNLDFMNHVMTIVSTITILAYIMYTLSPDVIKRLDCHYIYLTAIFPLIGIIRYLQITIVDLKSGSPTNILIKDHFIQICIIAWVISFLIIIYL
jgi:4-hydroxybenzoate polyprenyltransferase